MRDQQKGGGKPKGPRLNSQITASQMRLIGEDATAYGVVSRSEALSIAEERGLDLVEVSPNANPPVVKLIDYGKFKYQQQKKQAEAKKKQSAISLKEIQFRPNIEKHDLEVKLKRAEQFIEQGDRIKMIMQFRGREMAYAELGMTKFKEIIEKVESYGGVVESEPKQSGNRIIAMISTGKRKN